MSKRRRLWFSTAFFSNTNRQKEVSSERQRGQIIVLKPKDGL